MEPKEQVSEISYFSEDVEFSLENNLSINLSLCQIISDHNKDLGEVNVIFCSDEHLLQMNREYLDHDYYTDILTFPMSTEPLSGDLFISIDRVKDYALQNKITFLSELHRVIIHGVLHLVGYHDKTNEEQAEMTTQEEKYLAFLNTF